MNSQLASLNAQIWDQNRRLAAAEHEKRRRHQLPVWSPELARGLRSKLTPRPRRERAPCDAIAGLKAESRLTSQFRDLGRYLAVPVNHQRRADTLADRSQGQPERGWSREQVLDWLLVATPLLLLPPA